jgi:hypothetical protein
LIFFYVKKLMKLQNYIHHPVAFLLAIIVFWSFFIPLMVWGQEGIVPCDGTEGNECDFNAFVELIERVINWLLIIAVPVGTLMFAWAGVLYLTAAGNQNQISQATNIFKTVIFGIIIALVAYLLVRLVVETFLRPELSPLEALFLLSTGLV